jgi:hypothetical protein
MASWSDENDVFPLLPSAQNSWGSRELAEWFISGGAVEESRREIISEHLDGKSFLSGRVQGILNAEEMKRIDNILRRKLNALSIRVGILSECQIEDAICPRSYV